MYSLLFRYTLVYLFFSCLPSPAASEKEIPPIPSEHWIKTHHAQLNHLFQALDSNHPSAGKAKERWLHGEETAAIKALLHYYQNRPPAIPDLKPSLTVPHGSLERAQHILNRSIEIFGQPVPLPRTRNGTSINWNDRGPENDKEWAWAFNRHFYFNDLLEQYLRSEDPKWIEPIDTHIRDWVRSNPYPNRTNFTPAWRALEVARRIQDSWAIIFQSLQEDPHFTAEARLLLLSSIPDHADALLEHASIWGGNHILTEKGALVLIALIWPEFSDAPVWFESGLESLTNEILTQTYPDGAFIELTNHYQRVVLDNIQLTIDILQATQSEIPPVLLERVTEMWNYFALVMKPNGIGPLNNASDQDNNAVSILRIADKYDRPDWKYIATQGEAGSRPPINNPSLTFFPWAGQVIFRNGWSPDANWAFFDIGPEGSAHIHHDALHFSNVLNGQDFLVDAGRYTYQPGEWNDYFKSPRAHNVLEISGFRRREPPQVAQKPIMPMAGSIDSIQWIAQDLWFDSIQKHPPNGSVRQRRMVVFIPDHGWILLDQVIGFTPHQLNFHWHFAPRLKRAFIDQNFKLLTNTDGIQKPLSGQESPFIAGWHSSQYQEKSPNWEYQYQLETSGPSLAVWLIGNRLIKNASVTLVSNREVHIEINNSHYKLTIDPPQLEQLRSVSPTN